jgi:hypothetical protein
VRQVHLRGAPLIPFHGGVRATVLGFAVAVALLPGCKRPPPAAPEAAVKSLPIPEARCVYFKDLRSFLPADLPGFAQSKDEGSTGKYGEVQVSEARRTFTRSAGRELSVRIVDTTMGADLGKAIRAAAQDGAGRARTDPTAPLFLDDAVGFVRFDPSSSDPTEAHAEATLWVGDRFVVAVSSQGFDNTDEVRRVARQLDLAGLAKLRLDGARRGP